MSRDRHVDRARGLRRLFIERVALPCGGVWIATDGRDDVMSTTIWSLPDVVVPDSVLREMYTARRRRRCRKAGGACGR